MRLLQSGTAFLLQIEMILLQSGTGITKWDRFITKRDRYYKVRRLLQWWLEQLISDFTEHDCYPGSASRVIDLF